MLSAIRRRFTYANVALTLILVFAMSGGAYAANRYLITSTKQISPKVLSALRGKAGKTGKTGPTGPAGIAGAAGAQGLTGATGPQGPAATAGKEGPEGKQGPKGENGTTGFTATLPSGKTETGTWSYASAVVGGSSLAPISFTIPLEVAPEQVFYVTKNEYEEISGATPPEACHGTAEAPTAKAGNLCVYEGSNSGTFFEIIKPESGSPGAGTTGAVVFFLGEESGGTPAATSGFGTWAVTAH